MNIVRKAIASIEPGADDADTAHGSFTVVLSTGTKDRDGEEVKSAEWQQPLPEHITMDVDHGMSVMTTAGSGRPSLDAKGRLIVTGTYASTELGQNTRALVNEGHITHTSVAFVRKSGTDRKGAKVVQRELINGAFVSIPANTEAMIVGSKVGARNSAMDAGSIQKIHDAAKGLGASCAGTGKAMMMPSGGDMAPGGDMAAGDAADAADDVDVATLAASIDDSLDQAVTLLAGVDTTTLPAEVQQAILLVQAADAASDDLMGALGVYDPPDDPGTDTAAPAAAKAAADAAQVKAIRSRIQQLAQKAGNP